jgi:retron-type reverse transcriptase
VSNSNYPYDQICNPVNLLIAWRQVRYEMQLDNEALAHFEYAINASLYNLAARLSDGSYYSTSVSGRTGRAKIGSARGLDFQTIEDAIVQQAVLNAIEPFFVPDLLDCGFINPEIAADRLLKYRTCGDLYIVESEIADCSESLDHDLIMLLIGDRVEDERLLRLIWMWLQTGRIFKKASLSTMQERTVSTPSLIKNNETAFLKAMIVPLLTESDNADSTLILKRMLTEIQKAERTAAFKRFGRYAGLFALASMIAWVVSKLLHRKINLKIILLTGVALLAALNYKSAARLLSRKPREMVGEKPYPGKQQAIMLPESPLSPLLADIVFHEFDLAMRGTGLHFVRHQGHFAITTRDKASAHAALNLAVHELNRLKFRLNPQKTHIVRLDQTVEFFGYQFQDADYKIQPSAWSNQHWKGLLSEFKR